MQQSIGIRNQLLFWFCAIIVFFLFVWAFKSILLPFILGAAIAYLLNPVVEFLALKGIGRTTAAVVILGSFFLVIGALMGVSIPILSREIVGFINDAPVYMARLWELVQPYQVKVQNILGHQISDQLQTALQDNIGKALKVGQGVAVKIFNGSMVLVDFITILVLTPITAFYMMREWPSITQWVYDLVPRNHVQTVQGLLQAIDGKIAGFVRGQITICMLLGLIYAVALSLAGLNYGFVIGIATGVLSIIPYVGSSLGLVVSLVVAGLQSDWSAVYIGVIAAIFITGQLIEGNVITPKLMGESVGIHALWIIFALMAGGALFGLVGMMLAIPVAAVVGVLVQFAIDRYKQSPYYKAV